MTTAEEEAQKRRIEAAEKYRKSIKPVPDTRAEVSAALRAEEERRNKEAESEEAAAARMRVAIEADKADKAPKPYVGLPEGYSSARQIDPGETGAPLVPATPAGAAVGGYTTVGKGYVVPANPGRTLLNTVSGGATENVIAEDKGKTERAEREIVGKGLSGYSPEELARLRAAAGYTPRGQQSGPQALVRVAPQWQPGTRTAATGMTGMDPAAQDALFVLEKGRGINDEEALRQTQAADALKHQQMLAVQVNALKAEEAFRRDQTSIQQRYDTERAEQMERLKQVQQAMDEVGKSPRTIREWLDSSGTGRKVTFGLAAALSAIGGAMGRRGNQPLQDLFNRTQASIDAKVKQEQDAYRILGEKAKLSDSVYARIRQATQDDTAALNITKAMYYDALGHMVDQIGTQYKLDMQSPQVLDFMSKLSGRYQDLIKETATKFQEQSSQTDKFNPGGVFAVGGAAKAPKDEAPGEGEQYFYDRREKYGKERQARGINTTEDTIEHLDNFDKVVGSMGAEQQKVVWGALAQVAALKDPKLAAGIVAGLPPEEAKAAALLLQSVEKRRKDLSGANYTQGEGITDLFKLGGATRQGIRSYRDQIAAEKEGALTNLGETYPDVAESYESGRTLRSIAGGHLVPGGRARQPATVEEQKIRGTARVQ